MDKVVTFGERLLRLSLPSHLRLTQTVSIDIYYGCAEANVAASLSKFGLPVKFITAVPPNELGESSLRMLQSFGVETIAKTQRSSFWIKSLKNFLYGMSWNCEECHVNLIDSGKGLFCIT